MEDEPAVLSPSLKAKLAVVHDGLRDIDDPIGTATATAAAAAATASSSVNAPAANDPVSRLAAAAAAAAAADPAPTAAATAAVTDNNAAISNAATVAADDRPNAATTASSPNTLAAGGEASSSVQSSRFQKWRTLENGVLQSCDAIAPDATFSGGFLTILRSISCKEPTVRTEERLVIERVNG